MSVLVRHQVIRPNKRCFLYLRLDVCSLSSPSPSPPLPIFRVTRWIARKVGYGVAEGYECMLWTGVVLHTACTSEGLLYTVMGLVLQ
jgi:hypothetical protein